MFLQLMYECPIPIYLFVLAVFFSLIKLSHVKAEGLFLREKIIHLAYIKEQFSVGGLQGFVTKHEAPPKCIKKGIGLTYYFSVLVLN